MKKSNGMNKVSKPKSDIYEMWEKSGQLPQIMDFIRDCARKLVTQREMCTYLNINESTFSRLKKAYIPENLTWISHYMFLSCSSLKTISSDLSISKESS